MPELLFLLLPVAAAYGWFMGRNSLKTKELKSRTDLARNFSSGLNFLLTDQEDKAIEQLLELLDVESASIDTYLALANLFRRKGDWDKAIKMHEKLHQLSLPKSKSQLIQFELAKDYYSAGLYDRAELLLVPLTTNDTLREAILKLLFSIFLATNEPEKALGLAEVVEQTDSKSLRIALANMQVQLLGSQASQRELQNLVERYPQAVRPRFALIEQALANQKWALARDSILNVLQQKPQWSAELLPKLQQCGLTSSEWFKVLQPLAEQKHNISARSLFAEQMAVEQGIHSAEQYLLQVLQQQPNIRLFAKLLQLKQQQSRDAAVDLALITQLVQAYLDSKSLYSCRSCGFQTRQPYWLCPSCKQWESVEPITGIDGR